MCNMNDAKMRNSLSLLIAIHLIITIIFYVLWATSSYFVYIWLPGIRSPLFCYAMVAFEDHISDFMIIVSLASIFLMPLATIATAFVSIFSKSKLSYLIVCVIDVLISTAISTSNDVPLWEDCVSFVLNVAMVAVMFVFYVKSKKRDRSELTAENAVTAEKTMAATKPR